MNDLRGAPRRVANIAYWGEARGAKGVLCADGPLPRRLSPFGGRRAAPRGSYAPARG